MQRHRTAMARRALSTPMQALWRHGLLDAPRTVFDYGCGRGDDLAALTAARSTREFRTRTSGPRPSASRATWSTSASSST
ncbi:MAG: hypothetical protein R3A52_04320 [Polyangiales bacterium]